jgi:DNA topoisomerase-1
MPTGVERSAAVKLRRTRHKGWRYVDAAGLPFRDPATLAVIAEVAALLGNTPAICRECYTHPAILEAHMDGTLSARYRALAAVSHPGLSVEEAAVMALLDEAA